MINLYVVIFTMMMSTAYAEMTPGRSAIIVTADTTPTTILLIGPQGHRVGWDRKPDGAGLQEIPHSFAGIDYLGGDTADKNKIVGTQQLGIHELSKGIYHLRILGLQEGPFEVDTRPRALNGIVKDLIPLKGRIKKDQVLRYQLLFDPTAGALEIKPE